MGAATTRRHKPGTFAFVPLALAFDPDIGKPGLQIAMLMASRASKDGECWLSTSTMAALLRKPRSFIIKGLAQLMAGGHLSKRDRPGTSTVYKLLFRDPSTVRQHDRESRSGGDRESRSGGDRQHDPENGSGGDRLSPENLTDFPGHNHNTIEKEDNDDDEEPPQSGASSAAAAAQGEVLTEEDEAALAYHEVAERMGWPTAGAHLTSKEREQMTARLRECGGVKHWRALMADAERDSRYLANTKPGLKFFLDEDNFAQLLRGRYGSKFDRKSRFEIFMEAGREAAAGRPAYTPPAPPPPRPAPEPSPIEDVPRFVVNLCAGAGMTAPAIAVKWRAWVSELEAAGWATGKAQQSVTEACRRARPVPGAVADVDQVILNTAKGVAA